MIVAGALRWGCALWLLSTSPGDAPELPRTLPRANHGRYKPYSGNRRKNQRPTIDRIAAGWQAAAPPCALCFLPVSPRLREMRAWGIPGMCVGLGAALVSPWSRSVREVLPVRSRLFAVLGTVWTGGGRGNGGGGGTVVH